MKTLNNENERVEFYNPNDIVIAKYKKYYREEFDLFIMYNFLYKSNRSYELGKCFTDLETHKLIGLLNYNNNNCFHVDTVHYGDYFSNINVEYYIPLIEVYTLMGKTDILNKGYVNREDMKVALDYIRNNNEDEEVINKMEPKQRIRRK